MIKFDVFSSKNAFSDAPKAKALIRLRAHSVFLLSKGVTFYSELSFLVDS
jgi:hypothetical protein